MKHTITSTFCRVAMVFLFLQGTGPAARPQTPPPGERELDLGYTRQSARSVGGAISTVSGEELEKSPVADLTQTFSGRLPGLTTMETNGQLSKSIVLNYIRGLSTINGQAPLILLDGVICSQESVEYITPQEIETISVLKDASLTAIYGIEGGNGAIVITTKRGKIEGFRVSATVDQSFQQMTRRPTFISSAEYASLRNEAWRNDGSVGTAPYSAADIEAFRNGTDRELYPNTDYYGDMFGKWAMMQRAGISTTVGSEKIRMFSNINFMHQGGQFKHDDATFKPGDKTYDPKAGENYRVNFRTNLDFRITPKLEGFLRLNGNVTKENTAGATNDVIYGSLFYLPPTLYGPYTPMSVDPDNPNRVYGGEVVTNEYVDNPAYGLLNRSGFSRYTATNIMAQAGLNLDLGSLTEGLSLRGMFAYETNSSGEQHVVAGFERWVRDNNPNRLEFVRIGEGTWNNKPLDYDREGYRASLFSYRMNANVQADYSRSFGDHTLSAMAYGYYQNYISERTDGIYGFPYNRISAGINASWGFRNRYFVKADVAYSGSDQFARKKRFTVTPALSAAWIVSEEPFMSGVKWIDFLKLRASAGITANDQLGGGRFLYTDNYVNGGAMYIGSLGYMVTEYMRGNPALAAEKIFKQNYGIEMTLFRDFSLSVDYFRSYTDDMVVNGSGEIPSFTGITPGITAPVNGGEMKNHGIEATAGYFKSVNGDLDLYANAHFMFARNEVVNVREMPLGKEYAYPHRNQGYSFGQPFGYRIDYSQGGGYFTSQAEIDRVYYAFGTPRLGDFRYQNLNGDKTADGRDIIDEKDLAPIGKPLLPEITYGLQVGARWRAFELSVLFQGSGNSSRIFHTAMGMDESLMGGLYSDIHRNAWTPERYAAGEKIGFPALSQQQSPSRQPNDFFIMNTSYLRLKNLELAYSLPQSVLNLIHARQVKVVFNAQNLFTWDKMKTDSIDPEVASLDTFQNYRVFNIGLKLNF